MRHRNDHVMRALVRPAAGTIAGQNLRNGLDTQSGRERPSESVAGHTHATQGGVAHAPTVLLPTCRGRQGAPPGVRDGCPRANA